MDVKSTGVIKKDEFLMHFLRQAIESRPAEKNVFLDPLAGNMLDLFNICRSSINDNLKSSIDASITELNLQGTIDPIEFDSGNLGIAERVVVRKINDKPPLLYSNSGDNQRSRDDSSDSYNTTNDKYGDGGDIDNKPTAKPLKNVINSGNMGNNKPTAKPLKNVINGSNMGNNKPTAKPLKNVINGGDIDNNKPTAKPLKTPHTFACGICTQAYSTKEEMKAHCKKEKHFMKKGDFSTGTNAKTLPPMIMTGTGTGTGGECIIPAHDGTGTVPVPVRRA